MERKARSGGCQKQSNLAFVLANIQKYPQLTLKHDKMTPNWFKKSFSEDRGGWQGIANISLTVNKNTTKVAE